MTLPARVVGAAKRFAGPILANRLTGIVAARLLRDRIPHRGLIIDTSAPFVQPEIKAALLLRGYESGEYRFVQRYLPADSDVLELGGSLGVISCAIRRRIAPQQRLITVEADPRLARALKRNLDLNNCGEGVIVEPVAVAYQAGDHVAFSLGETSVSGRVGTGGTKIKVAAVTLSQLIERHALDDFSLVSDVEGIEWEMLSHDIDALARARVIIVETHDHPIYGSWQQLIDRLLATRRFRLLDRHGCVLVLERAPA